MSSVFGRDALRSTLCLVLALAAIVAVLAAAVAGSQRSQPGVDGVIEPNLAGEVNLVDVVDRAIVESPLITKMKDAIRVVDTCLTGVPIVKECVVSEEDWRFAPKYTTGASECWCVDLPEGLVSSSEMSCREFMEVLSRGRKVEYGDRSNEFLVGYKLQMFPELGSIDFWGSERWAWLDWPHMSLGVDFGSMRKVAEVSLSTVEHYRHSSDRDGLSRADRDQIEVYCSDDDLHYRPVDGWTYNRQVRGGNHEIVLGNLDTLCRYLKIHTKHNDDEHVLRNQLQEMVSVIFADYPVDRWFQEGERLYVSIPNSGGTKPPAGRYVIRYVSKDERNKSFLALRRCCSSLAPALPLSESTPVGNVLARHATIGKETREVLLAPAPATFTYRVKVTRNTVLSFGYGLLPIDTKTGPRGVCFEVLVTPQGGECQQLFHVEPGLKYKSKLNRWFDARIDLSELGAGVMDISFVTSSASTERTVGWVPVWSTPVLTASDGEDKTSIILVTVCTLRADHLGCHGYPRATSPNIDRYATSGVLFEHAQTQWPQTEPSFTSILTGAYPHTTGVMLANKQQLPRHLRMLPEMLREQGYTTAAVVANSAISKSWGFDRGFGTFIELWGKPKKVWNAQDVTNSALSWLSRNEDRTNLFLWVLYADPHWPYAPPPPYDRRFVDDPYYDGSEVLGDAVHRRGFGGLADYVRLGDHREKDYYVAQYDGEIAFLDASIQPLLEAIDRVSVDRKYLEVFLADHGETMGEHNNYFTHGAFAYEEVLHVPLILHGSGPVLSGKRVREPVALIDVAPTVLEFAGIQRPLQFEGESLLSSLYDGRAVLDGEAYSEAGFEALHQQVLRMGNFKFILVRDRTAREMIQASPAELYDVAFDTGESQNVVAKFPKHVGAMRAEIGKINEKSRDLLHRLRESAEGQPGVIPPRPIKVDQEVLDHLKALGYVD